jgi:hypothetical protein
MSKISNNATQFYKAYIIYRDEVGPVYETDIDRMVDILHNEPVTAEIIQEIHEIKENNILLYHSILEEIKGLFARFRNSSIKVD